MRVLLIMVIAQWACGGPAETTGPPTTGNDTEAPSAPTGLTASPVSASQIDLTWNAATDNIGVTGYIVFRDALAVDTTTALSYSDTGLASSTTYDYSVSALDAAQNVSTPSGTVNATTNAAAPSSCGASNVHCVDDSPGPTQEFTSIQSAADAANPGDTVLIHAGSYTGFQVNQSGTAQALIVFQGMGASTIINAASPTGDGIRLQDVDYITLDNITIRNPPQRCVAARGATASSPMVGNVIRRVDCSGSGVGGFYFSQFANGLIENNVITSQTGSHGIYLANGGSDGTTIRGNRISDVTGGGHEGIHINGDISVGGDGIASNLLIERNVIYDIETNGINMDGVQDITIQNNLLFDISRHAIRGFQLDGGGGPANLRIVHNTLITRGASGWAIKLTQDAGGHTIFNNILLGTSGSIVVAHTNVVSNNNIVTDAFSFDGENTTVNLAGWQATGFDSASNIEPDPFENAGADDYHLKSGAQAVDAGVPSLNGVTAPLFDIDGTARPQGSAPDAGAYERT